MRIKLKYPDVDTFIQKYSVNISRGGIFIATRTPKPVGTLVRFEFQLSDTTPVIRGEGQVIWVKTFDPDQPKKVHGMGVRFTRLDSESRTLVDRALAWKRENLKDRPPRPDETGESGTSPPRDTALTERIPERRTENSFEGLLPLPDTSAPHDLPPPSGSSFAEPLDPAGDDAPAPASAAGPDDPVGQKLSLPEVPSASTFSWESTSPTSAHSQASPGTEEKVEPQEGPAPTTRSQMDNEAVAELWQSSQSNIVRAARHIAELTAAHIYYPEDTELASLLKPLRIPLPQTGREASRLLAAILDRPRG
jgi:uncharacterized protein (TIGR02266 family)